jgi:hypothetical protein
MINLQFFPNAGCMINRSLCLFDATLSTAGIIVILTVLVGLFITYNLLKQRSNNPWRHLLILGLGVLLFELFTAPMWNSEHLGSITYIYNDLSLVLTTGWVVVFMLSFIFVDTLFPGLHQNIRFFIYLVPITISTIITETLFYEFGIRSYAPEVWEASMGNLGVLPIEILYYAPVFASLVISFYLAWTTKIKLNLHNAFEKNQIVRSAVILTIGITLYELLVEPIVQTPGFPSWSYFYQDISFVRIGLWVIMLFIGTWLGSLIVKSKKIVSDQKVFWVYVMSSAAVFYVVETILLKNRGRVYTASVTENFMGLVLPIMGTPVEVVLAIIIYLTVIISFLKYWSFSYTLNKK